MPSTKSILMLAIVLCTGVQAKSNCPSHCKCNYEGRSFCSMGDTNVTLSLDALGFKDSSLKMECQGTNFTCSDLPQLGVIGVNRYFSYFCPPRILTCLKHILGDLALQSVYLGNTSEVLTLEDAVNSKLKCVTRFWLNTTDDALVINNAAINWWNSLEHAYIQGGYFNLSTAHRLHNIDLKEIILESTVAKLPVYAFHGLMHLNILYIKGTAVGAGDIDIPRGAFYGLHHLTQLHFENARIKSIEVGTFEDTPHLEELNIIDNPLESMTNGLLRGLKSLNKIKLHCKGNKIDLGTHAFYGLVALQQVTISGCNFNNLTEYLFSDSKKIRYISVINNVLSYLPAKIFSHLTNMTGLYLDNNDIQELPNEIFVNLTSLKILGLAENSIQVLHDNIFIDLVSLKELYLQGNRIEDLPYGIFDKMTSLTVLRLDHNNLETLRRGFFDAIISLKKLDLSDNDIYKLPNGLFATMTSLECLNLMNNDISGIHDNMFKELTKLRNLHLNNNSFSLLSKDFFSTLTALENLTIHDNEIWEPLPDLTELRSLKYLDMSNIDLHNVPLSMFSNLGNLTHLILKNNYISKIDALRSDSSIDEKNNAIISPFLHLKKLVMLDLSENNLQQLYRNWQNDLKQVKELNLSKNYFSNIKDFQGDFSDMNITIDLRYNNISEAVLTPRVSYSNDTPPATSVVILNDNPIACDCNIYGLFLRSKGARSVHEPQYDLSTTVCEAPPSLKGRLLKDVPPEQLICDLFEHLPVNCSSYIAIAINNEVVLHCPELPLRWIDFKINDFRYKFFEEPTVTLHLEKQPKNIEHLNIHKLNLSNANIHKIDFSPTDSLKVLDLSHNNLVSVPDEFLNGNIMLYLADNPLKCDCQLVRKLKNMTTLSDAASVTCHNEGKLTDIDADELCGRLSSLISVIGISAVCGAFVIMITIPICKYIKRNWRNIKVNLKCSRRLNSETIHLKQVEESKEFDLFISFTYQDEEFVRENLLLKLEYELKQKVCVYYRDWSDEDLVTEQIIKAVDNSTKTVIILTQSFLNSQLTYVAFTRAHFLSKQDSVSRIIVILLNSDITQNERFNDDLKSYVTSDSCLLWGDPNFWIQIKDILPKKLK